MDNEERRKFGRVKMTFPVEFGSSDSLKGETFDLSGSGLRVITKFSLTCFQKMKIYLNLPPCFSADPEKAIGIKANGCAVWSKKMKNQKYMSGVNFLEIVPEDFEMLQKIIHSDKMTSKISTKKPEFKISREIHSCNMYAIDLTVGCEHKCLYCHFSTIKKNEWQKENFCATEVIPVDLAPLYRLKQMPDSVVYLSPSSDAFAPLARDLTHELLSYMLPKGVIFTISTKAIIPQKTIKLLKKYKHLIEGIAVGITNLDKDRNALLEPGVPPANERIEHLKELVEIGCPVGIRMDPIFPLVDDNDENLEKIIKKTVKNGIVHLSATYFFSFGKFLKELSKKCELTKSMSMIREKSFPLGGKSFSVPLEYKRSKYLYLNDICCKHGIKFHTCGCKQMELREEPYSLVCRNLDYYDEKEKNS